LNPTTHFHGIADLTDTRQLTSKGQKRIDSFLHAAADLFLTHGYDDLRLDQVIAVTGGSKVTLYRNFGSKEQLFEAVIEYICAGYERDLRALDLRGDNPNERFRCLAQAHVELALSERHLRFYRLVMGNSARFPVVGKIWYERGLVSVSSVFLDFLSLYFAPDAVDRQRLSALADALQGALVFRLMSEAAVLQTRPSDARIAETVEILVEIFLGQLSAIENRDIKDGTPNPSMKTSQPERR
jgi:AcrR family transcriptional regulator